MPPHLRFPIACHGAREPHDIQVTEETHDKQPGHNVHRGVLGLRLWNTVRDVVFTNVIDQHRTENAGD
jgi:hypothetical protein